MSQQLAAGGRTRRFGAPAWFGLFVFCVLVLSVADTALIEVTRGALTTGFGGPLLDTLPRLVLFGVASLGLDAFLVLALWAAGLPILRRLRVSPARRFAIAGLAAVAIPLWMDVAIYEIHSIVGALLTPGVVLELAGGSASSFAEASTPAAMFTLTGAGVTAVAAWLGLWIVGRATRRLADPERALAAPRARACALGALALALAMGFALSRPSAEMQRVRDAARLKPSFTLLAGLSSLATDFDRDGYDLLSRPPDPAAFDARVHPHALDTPGNRVDENRLAGDHPSGTRAPEPIEAKALVGPARPHLLLVYLESFRADTLGARRGGVAVTPFLSRLAAEGAASQHAYVHSPFTTRSRGQLFGGRLDPQPGQLTLVDDLARAGYRVALFSGQDDSFGGSEALIGSDRADYFYDARRDSARRTSRSTAPASLQVSWKLLLERVRDYLDGIDPAQPLFLYVNVVDTHYPYHHDRLDRLLPIEPVARSGIRAANRERVVDTYLNAAANVDRAVEQVVGEFRRAIAGADHAILVTSDHGQAFYEDGFLGHGRALDRAQTHVPLIVWGIGGAWPEPLGAADLRGLLLGNLGRAQAAGPPPRVRFEPDPERRVFQYLPRLDEAVLIGRRGLDGAVLHDFIGDGPRAVNAAGEAVDTVDIAEWTRVIRDWEALRLAQDPASPSSQRPVRNR